MPSDPDESLADAVAGRKVCAFICAPIVNPLNGKTVGPDRSRVKALARVTNWKGEGAEFWIQEEYLAVERGDVIADLHEWAEGKPKGAGKLGSGDWFSVIGSLDAAASPPARSEAPDLERGVTLVFSESLGASRLERISYEPPRVIQPKPEPKISAPVPNPSKALPHIEQEALNKFVISHHAKSTRGDVDGMAADYAEQVAYMNHGTVSREFIRKDEASYHSPGTRILETVVSWPPAEVQQDGMLANYTIAFSRQTPDGKWMKGDADISMRVRRTPQGFQIVEQHIKIRNKQQGP